jgi:dTDP-4-dehydrorhamnose reductase
LGNSLISHLGKENHDLTGITNSHSINPSGWHELKFDITDVRAIPALLDKFKPDVVVYAAGLTDVDACESNEGLAQKIHSEAPKILSSACLRNNIKFVLISTDHLWDGNNSMMQEDDPLQPVNVYGRTKAHGERCVTATNSSSLIIRTNFFGKGLPWRKSISDWMIEKLLSGDLLHGFADSFFTPISLYHLVRVIVGLVESDARGTYHVAGRDRLSKYAFALKISELLSLPKDRVVATSLKKAKLIAPRPMDLSLCTDKITKQFGTPMPSIDEGIDTLNLNYLT